MQAYCMKCRKKVEIQNAKSIVMKNKRPATQGVCPNCGTKVVRIGKGYKFAVVCGGWVLSMRPSLFVLGRYETACYVCRKLTNTGDSLRKLVEALC